MIFLCKLELKLKIISFSNKFYRKMKFNEFLKYWFPCVFTNTLSEITEILKNERMQHLEKTRVASHSSQG